MEYATALSEFVFKVFDVKGVIVNGSIDPIIRSFRTLLVGRCLVRLLFTRGGGRGSNLMLFFIVEAIFGTRREDQLQVLLCHWDEEV